MLKDAQLTTLAAAIAAETDQTFVGFRTTGNNTEITNWYNAASTTDAWRYHAERSTLFEATDVTKFDGLTAGKRDAWRLLMDNTPIDMGRNANRKAVQDIWGNTDSVAVLQALREKATRAQVLFGGTSKTTNTVTALDRAFTGLLSIDDVRAAVAL
jgi:hypothetical protein